MRLGDFLRGVYILKMMRTKIKCHQVFGEKMHKRPGCLVAEANELLKHLRCSKGFRYIGKSSCIKLFA